MGILIEMLVCEDMTSCTDLVSHGQPKYKKYLKMVQFYEFW